MARFCIPRENGLYHLLETPKDVRDPQIAKTPTVYALTVA